MDLFFEIHKDLPREGPGDSESTRRALALLKGLPPQPQILDLGCGPGMQTLDLARASQGKIVAVDTHQPFLDQLQRRAEAEGLTERVRTLNQSMFELKFPEKSFDLIWCEGAIYIIGFEAGLQAWKPLLKPEGYVAVTEISWLKPDPPREVYDFWMTDYPGMSDLRGNLARLQAAGYREISHFTLPPASWWTDYYNPIEARLPALWEKYRGLPEAEALLEATQKECDMHRKYAEYYGYVFYIMQVCDQI